MTECEDHSRCEKYGLKCINRVCGDPNYFTALGEMDCEKDYFCKVKQ